MPLNLFFFTFWKTNQNLIDFFLFVLFDSTILSNCPCHEIPPPKKHMTIISIKKNNVNILYALSYILANN